MSALLFKNTEEKILTDLRVFQRKQINFKRNPYFRPSGLILFLLFLVGLSYYFATNYHTNEIHHPQNIQKLETLIQKVINNETLSAIEWNELCQLLGNEKGINIIDCENCQDYLRALLGGKHSTHLRNYEKRTDKEIQKGINSYQKQIELHKEKIKNPKSHYPDWDNLDERFRNDLITEKWNEDIQRNTEQKRILECILKNR